MGKDLAQACRDHYPAWTRWPNWLACELAIGACDLAEVLGSAVAINLLFHIPLLWAVLITAFDVIVLLSLQSFGMRMIEAVILVLVSTIAACYFIEIFVSSAHDHNRTFWKSETPDHTAVSASPEWCYTAIAIIGATVMPHNLYLHSALVQSRKLQSDDSSIRKAIQFNTIDSTVALLLAMLVNAAIVVLAAMVFFGKQSVALSNGQSVRGINDKSDWMRIAFLTLSPLLGAMGASLVFGIALLASGQSSTITGTLAGQVVMEGFMRWRMRPWLRRLLTRMLAIVPAIIVIGVRGDGSVTELLILSQVVLRAATSAGDDSADALHQLEALHGQIHERLVSARGRLDFLHTDNSLGSCSVYPKLLPHRPYGRRWWNGH